jgi:hypothetical protein
MCYGSWPKPQSAEQTWNDDASRSPLELPVHHLQHCAQEYEHTSIQRARLTQAVMRGGGGYLNLHQKKKTLPPPSKKRSNQLLPCQQFCPSFCRYTGLSGDAKKTCCSNLCAIFRCRTHMARLRTKCPRKCAHKKNAND